MTYIKKKKNNNSKKIFIISGIILILLVVMILSSNISTTGEFFKRNRISFQCNDQIDNDGDGYCDFSWKWFFWGTYCRDNSIPGDPDCTSRNDNDESSDCKPICYTNKDCGINDYINNPYCKDNNIYRDYVTYICKNAGKCNALCNEQVSSKLLENCQDGCSNGQCAINLPPVCSDECTYGDRICSGIGYKICGSYDNDDCSEWGSSTSCPNGQTCSNGQCTLSGEITYFTSPFAYETVNVITTQKIQIHYGFYDELSKKTYIVYPAGIKGSQSACSPYIISYDHTNRVWSDPVKILTSPVKPDAHNYPQVLVDNQGYIHAFQTFHANNNIMHVVSKNPGDITDGYINFIEGTYGATYGAAFKSKNGDMYLFYRLRESDPINTKLNYEPEYYIKSTDNGKTWQHVKLIDPKLKSADDHWGTVYTKAMHYEASPEGIHITFGIHKDHNIYHDKHYYIFFSFTDNHIYSVTGKDFGTTITKTEFEADAELFRYGKDMSFFGTPMAIDLDENNYPIIFYNKKYSDGKQYLEALYWNGATWDLTSYKDLGEMTYPYEIEVPTRDNIKVYMIRWSRILQVYNFKDKKFVDKQTIIEFPKGTTRLRNPAFIFNYRPELKGVFIEGEYSDWTNPLPTGKLYIFGEK